jgi:glycosyltransferase involved in cell wall biosynthesis
LKLSVVVPNRNDTVMLAITVRSILEELKAVAGGGEIVIVDNSDEDLWLILKTMNVSPLALQYVEEGKVQLIHQKFSSIYSARAEAIRSARGEYVYNVDSHMLIGHNTLKDMVDFMDADKEGKVGFAFSPIGWFSAHEALARHDIRIDQGTIFGSWGKRYYKPMKICWNFGSCICRTKWFNGEFGGYGFFDKKRVSWGGGEFYAAMKGWLLGYENWAVPTNPQYHIGPFSKEIETRTPYRFRLYGKSGEWEKGMGIFAAFYALGGDEMKEEARKAEVAGVGRNYGISVDRDWETAKELAHEDWLWLKERQEITYFELMEKQPWKENGWGNWGNWKPDEEAGIKRVFSLSDLKVIG